MYIFFKSTSSNSTLVTNYLSKYTWKLEFAGVLYQLRFVQPLLLMWLCRFIFGDCLPLSLALHHLLTTINRATATPIFAQQRISTEPVHLIAHPKHHSSLRWRPWLSPQHTGARTHNRTMPRVSRSNPMADSSDDESPPKKNRSPPPPRSLLPPPLREQRQRQRRPQRAPIPKNQQPQPLESKHHRGGEGRRLWLYLPKGKAPVWK